MPFTAPTINVQERAAIVSTPTLDSSSFAGAFIGTFQKGPVNRPILIQDEAAAIRVFGEPTKENQEDYLTLTEFLSYGGPAYVTRIANDASRNAKISGDPSIDAKLYTGRTQLEDELAQYDHKDKVDVIANTPGKWANGLAFILFDSGPQYVLVKINDDGTEADMHGITVGQERTVMITGSSMELNGDIVENASYVRTVDVWDESKVGRGKFIWLWSHRTGTNTYDGDILGTDSQTVPISDANAYARYVFINGDKFIMRQTNRRENSKYSFGAQRIPVGGTTIRYQDIGALPGTTINNAGENFRNDEVNYAVIDVNKNEILETGTGLSKLEDSIDSNLVNNYYVDAINERSEYVSIARPIIDGYQFTPREVYAGEAYSFVGKTVEDVEFNDVAAQTLSPADGTTKETNPEAMVNRDVDNRIYLAGIDPSITFGRRLNGGVAVFGYTESNILQAMATLNDTVNVPFNFFITGSAIPIPGSNTSPIELLERKIEAGIRMVTDRQDAILFASPIGAMIGETTAQTTENIINFFSRLDHLRTSFVLFDSGMKRMRSRFTRKNAIIPCNGDVAGVCRRTVVNNGAAVSPAGIVRGVFTKTLPELLYNPTSSQRNDLYRASINSIARVPGAAPYLLGDRTSLLGDSVYTDLSVRLLFISLRNFITEISNTNIIYNKNNADVREGFQIKVNAFLEYFLNNQLIRAFRVVADESNNPPEVVNSGRFVANVFIQPLRSINEVNINVNASDSAVDITELVGGE